MTVWLHKLREVLLSVSPFLVLVLLLHFFLIPLGNLQLLRFLMGSVFVILGLSIFLVGVDLGVTPFGNRLGESIAKSGKLRVVLLAGLLLGFFISMAEPDLHILATEISAVTDGQINRWLLVIFMAGVNAGFMDVGRAIGAGLAGKENTAILVIIGFVLGLVSILTEPAVHVLTRQIEDVTSGSIRKNSVLAALALGVGSAVALSVLRILLPSLELWHILLPGYLISLVLAHLGSKLFVGIAFDSGGVASGPMTATFILAYTQGAATATENANVLMDGFGVIALDRKSTRLNSSH